ncbi:HAD-IA family hydrolase [Mobilicoccus pelagius]|uniref:Putative phosphatase n=1 Tax=Mobilicoccus pelagius NBRC 104925 TaxID=1089455 RepID=H5UTA6_9MICO|nr:HAD-IA family hydrolase [Mobilicoccus pelagius]GAB48964.1 putative phosphatase [Mobilicoccus pelagius NBRC 104925]
MAAPNPSPLLTGVRALLLDMDGTLVDSHLSVERAWRHWAEKYDVDPEVVVAACHGATGDRTMRRFRPDLDDATVAAENAAHLERETHDVSDVVASTGAVELLDTCTRLGLPWAVVTNANTPLARARLGAAGIAPTHLVSVDDVEVGKPDPASYRLGAQRLDVPIEDCLAVEDSGTGLEAARAAGARVAMLGRDDGGLRIEDLGELARLLEAAHA